MRMPALRYFGRRYRNNPYKLDEAVAAAAFAFAAIRRVLRESMASQNVAPTTHRMAATVNDAFQP